MSDNFGANPAYIKWDVVRGDTSVLRVEFYNRNEDSPYDTTNWAYVCTVVNKKTNDSFTLDVTNGDGFATITASPEITSQWGTGIDDFVAQLVFDLEVTIDNDVVWTPVIGTISVIGDITGGVE